VVDRLAPKGTGSWRWVSHMPPRGLHAPRSIAGTYPRALLKAERGNPVSLLVPSGPCAVRHAHGGAGLGCWKKRTPYCNGTDTGLNVTRPEREPTSDGSFIARDVEESLAGGKANDNRGFFFLLRLGASAPSLRWDALEWRSIEKHARRRQRRIAKVFWKERGPGSVTGLGKA